MNLNKFMILSATSLAIAAVPISSYATQHLNQSSISNPGKMMMAQNQATMMMSGSFITAEKTTKGMARIIMEGGHHYLELDKDFSTSDQGPDLHVLVDTTNKPPQTYENMGSYVNLGKLKSFTGAQRYPIPDMVDPSQLKSVVIWCRMANATFGYAMLQ